MPDYYASISLLFNLICPSERVLALRADSFVKNGSPIKRHFLTFMRSLGLEPS